MKTELFDYQLPPSLIAQEPTGDRTKSRLLVLDRSTGQITHTQFRNITEYLHSDDTLVVNNTKVFKARLFGKRKSGAKVEIFLVRMLDDEDGERWEALAKPSRRLAPYEEIVFVDKESVTLIGEIGGGRWVVGFQSTSARRRIIEQFGHVPLPHYIKRDDVPNDVRRYQTVFARSDRTGAVAAPTAGFHFSKQMLARLEAMGVNRQEITLHVGPGTFKPMTADDITHHVVDPEWAEITESVADSLNRARQNQTRVVAVGTTTVRTLESARIRGEEVQPFSGLVDLYIRPGFEFKVVDTLITNFHLPKSSLLVLVSAFAGRELILKAYREAIEEKYRFYSYGDAMLIL